MNIIIIFILCYLLVSITLNPDDDNATQNSGCQTSNQIVQYYNANMKNINNEQKDMVPVISAGKSVDVKLNTINHLLYDLQTT
jgi:hypothetical protein